MKWNRKKTLVVSLVVAMLAILSVGTLAWFNATDEVTNKFQVATDDTGAPDFSIDVKENKTDEAGKNFVDADQDGVDDLTDTGNTYTFVVPGDEIKKNPMVTNTGDYAQWVRVNILISKAFADQVALTQDKAVSDLDFTKLFTDFNIQAFESARDFSATAYADYYLYAYYVAAPLAPNATVTAFTAINIPTTFTQANMTYGSFQVIVKADAVQVDNLEATASASFARVGWEAGTAYDTPIVEP